tara:strand:- start:88 stop:558 length:471 start_codon:yes stop_codon:yes gene_type:complete
MLEIFSLIFGFIGASAGIAGAWVSFVNQKKVQKIKSLDLRIALRRELNLVGSRLDEADILLPNAHKSRLRVLSMTGMLRSGKSVVIQKMLKEDTNSIKLIRENYYRTEKNINTDSYASLEEKLCAVDKIRIELDMIISRYRELLKEDQDTKNNHRA